jgi:hypothetical protein
MNERTDDSMGQGTRTSWRGRVRWLSLGLLACALSPVGCFEPLVREGFTYGPGGSSPDAIGLGDMCVPLDEDYAYFSGFSEGEINIATGDPQCASGVCLANRFQGRVTCPEGNLDGGDCFTPLGELVTVPVQPDLPDRPAEERVICSCRCDGLPEDGPFCDCPRGMTCEPLIDPRGQRPSDSGEGSYCVYD